MTDIASRIAQRLIDVDISERAASLQATGSPNTIRNIRLGDSKNPRADTIRKLAKVLKCSEHWLMTGDDAPAQSPNNNQPTITRTSMPYDIPVRGTAAGSELGKGAFQISLDVVDYVARPPGLANARDIYALYVEGDSMEPMYKSGDLVFVNPNKPIRINDTVIIQEQNSNNGEPQSFIKIFKKRSAKGILAQQLNPFSDIEFVAQSVKIHKVMTTNELFGV